MSDHRRDDQRRTVPKGHCTWCGDELLVTEAGLEWAREHLKPKHCVFKLKVGDVWPRVRNWHPWCVQAYMLRNNPGQTRYYVYKRDKGKCAISDCDSSMFDGWEADHIVPLVDCGGFEMENLQTLCTPHHKEKTKREAGERAARRKVEKGLTGQPSDETQSGDAGQEAIGQ